MKNELYILPPHTNSFHKKVHLFPNALGINERDTQLFDGLNGLQYPNEIAMQSKQNKQMKEEFQIEVSQKDIVMLYHHMFSKEQLARDFIAFHPVMRRIKVWAQQMAIRQIPIAICGTDGVGKRHLAQWIHQNDVTSSSFFFQIDCKTTTEQHMRYLLNIISRLSQDSLQQLLQGGTLYIHRIDCLSFDLQQEILELFFEQCNMQHKLRLIISLEHDANESYQDGLICESLFRKLGQYVLIPSLCERQQEISSFVSLFLKQASQQRMGQRCKVEKEAIDILSEYVWPGNLVELRQLIEKLLTAETNIVTKQALLGALPAAYVAQTGLNLTSLAEVEKAIIEKTLRICGNTLDDKKRAADILGISLSTLYNKMKIYNL